MWARLAIVSLLLTVPAAAQKLSVDAVVKMVRSSIELGHKDKKVAKYLENVQLTEKLSVSVIEDLQGYGAGPRTLEALHLLREQSANLTKAEPVVDSRLPPMPPPSPEEQERVIEEAREYAMSYVEQLPDFICTQVTRRYADPTGMEFWRKLDTVTAKVTYFDQKEDYKVILINNRPVNMDSIHDVGGSTSSGEFGSMMKELFSPETDAIFQWERWGKLRGRLCHVYNYFVPAERSKWTISFEKTMSTVPAYRGLVYVDKDTLTVSRIELNAVNIDPSFPIQEASTVLDYDLIEISGNEFMLPLKFKMNMRQGRLMTKNEVEFRLYNKYSADAVIDFNVPEELPDEMFAEEPPSQ